jgi:streptogramin lyase
VHVVNVEVGQPVSLAINLGETGVWFVDAAGDRLGRLTATGGLSWFSPPVGSRLAHVALGPDEALYVTERAANAIARFPLASFDPNAAPTAGRLTEELALTGGAQPFDITAGTDGNVWFTERGRASIGVVVMPTHCVFGRVTLADLATPVPAVKLTLAPAGLTATTDAAGNFQFCGLAAGTFTVTPSLASRSFTPASRPGVQLSRANLIDNNFVAR